MTIATPEVGYGQNWWRSLVDLDGAETRRIAKAVDRFLDDPDHPGLNLHRVESDRTGRLHTFRASRDLRILLVKEGNLYWLLEAGHHDTIYDRAARQRFVASGPANLVALVDRDRPSTQGGAPDHGGAPSEPAAETPAAASPGEGNGLFDHWADGDLRDVGLNAELIEQLRDCRSEDDLCSLTPPDDTFELLIELLETTPEQRQVGVVQPLPEVAVSATEEVIRRAILGGAVLSGVSTLMAPEDVTHLAAAPIEDWMVFLHPDQRALVERRFEGPARVRGSAGTGKTVVALHRAAALASRYRGWHPNGDADGPTRPPLLFTTFIRSLPPVLQSLYTRLPGTRPGDVDFLNIDKLAFAVCAQAGDRPTLDPRAVRAAFATAWKRTVVPGTRLHHAGLGRSYISDEITAVIKGRGIQSLDDYLAIERTGRRVPFGASLRAQVWELRQEWDRQMQARDTVDFADVVLRARDHARRQPHPRYRAAIIDEAQDLTMVGLQLVRALVNGGDRADKADGLFIVGDGAQRIYPGGFTLRQAGVEVRGRTTVLRHNYRNTRQIIEAAMAVAGHETVDDLGDVYERGDAPADARRSGMRPVLVTTAERDHELAFLVEEIRRLTDSGTIGPGDMAVATATNDQARAVADALAAAGIATQPLERYDGTPTPKVKVGTHFRIKGLEFKVVFLPGLGADDFPPKADHASTPAEVDEQRQLAVSRLFVAMTRARDGLFLLCSGQPSPMLDPSLDCFEPLDLTDTADVR